MSIAHVSDRSPVELASSRFGAQGNPQERDGQNIFGLHLSHLEPGSVAHLLLHQRREAGSGAAVLATANIQHIAQMRKNPEFRASLEEADLITCDGFPVYWYARRRGYAIERRTTGREIVDAIMESDHLPSDHRLFFLVDGYQTSDALLKWADDKGIGRQIEVEIAPPDFVNDEMYCQALTGMVSAFETTLFFLCTGAPQSEVFTHRYRSLLPDCWALCVGQSAKLVLGLTPQPPLFAGAFNLEWLWRIALEPRRMLKRYVPSALGFLAAVSEENTRRNAARC